MLITINSLWKIITKSLWWIAIIIGWYYLIPFINEIATGNTIVDSIHIHLFKNIYTINQLSIFVYIVAGYKILDSIIDGLIDAIIDFMFISIVLLIGFVNYDFIGSPFGVITTDIIVNDISITFSIQILSILLWILCVYSISLIFEILFFVAEKHNDDCFNPYFSIKPIQWKDQIASIKKNMILSKDLNLSTSIKKKEQILQKNVNPIITKKH